MPRSFTTAAVARALACTLAVVATAGLAACGRAPDAAAAIAESRQAGDAVTAPAGDDLPDAFDRRAGDEVRLPAGFPVDVLLPERYEVVSVTTMGAAQTVVLRTDAAMTPLYDRFRDAQHDRGWEETVSMQGVEGAMLGLRKGGRSVLANFRPDMQGRTIVSLSLQPQATAVR